MFILGNRLEITVGTALGRHFVQFRRASSELDCDQMPVLQNSDCGRTQVAGDWAQFPVLAGLPAAAIESLARAAVVRDYGPGHVLFLGACPGASDPLRFVVRGRISRGSSVARERAGAWVLGPGAVLGVDAVAAWAQVSVLARPPAGVDARTETAVRVLELSADRFAEAFAGPGAATLDRLLAAVPVRQLGPRLVAALAAQPGLARIRERELYGILEGCLARTVSDGSSIEASTSLHFVVHGGLRVATGSGHALSLGPGQLEPFDLCRPSERIDVDPESELVTIPRTSLIAALRNTPGHARTLAQLDAGAAELDPGVELHLIILDQAARLERADCEALVDGLEDSIVRQFGERVGVLRLVRSTANDEVDGRAVLPRNLPWNGVDACLRELEALIRRWGLCFDHLLLDASGLGLDAEVSLAELGALAASLRPRARVHYLADDPEAFERLSIHVGAVEVLAVALLQPGPTPVAEPSPSAKTPWSRDPEAFGAALARLLTRGPDHADPIAAELAGMPPQRLAWPVDGVRLDPRTEIEAGCGRWARATCSRRVGVAIAAAGAQSYVALPLLRGLAAAGIPVDVISGASVGAFIAGFYAGFGEAGLAQLEHSWAGLQALVVGAYVDNRALARWLARASDGCDLADLPIPAIVVSTDADTGAAHHHHVGLLAKACMASGSIPPAMPSYIGERRLLDGALVEDVPAAILAAAGAALRIAVQACPPMHADPRVLPRPRGARQRRRRARSVGLRLWDFGRSHLMLARLAAARGADVADVVYSATTTGSNPGLFVLVPRIIADARRSPALAQALDQAQARWTELRRPAATRVRVDPHTGRVELGRDLERAVELDGDPNPDPRIDPQLDPRCERLVVLLTRHAAAIPGVELELALECGPGPANAARAGVEAYRARIEACAGPGPRVVLVDSARAGLRLGLRLIPEVPR